MLSISPIRSICILGCIQIYDFYTLLMSRPLYHHILNSVSRHFLTYSLFSYPCSPLAPVCMEYLFPSLYFKPMYGLKMEVSLFYTAERWVFLFLLRFCSSVATEDRNWRARSSVVPGSGMIKHHGELRGAEAGNTSPPLSLRNWFVWGHRWVICGAGTIYYLHMSSDPGTVSFPNTMLFIFALSSVFKKKFIWNGTFCSNAKSQNQGKPSIQN